MARSTSAIDGVQGVIAIAGITLGVVPLVKWLFVQEHTGPFRFLFGQQTGAAAYVVPLLVIVAAFVVIGVLETRKRK